ncbi:MAG: nucleoside-triphosphatase [Bacillota bacterium]
MLHIITGEVNAGKTTRMKELYRQQQNTADGLISEKVFEGGHFLGYRLVHLQGCESMELALLKYEYHGQFSEACKFGPFVFSEAAFRFGVDLLRRLCADASIDSVYLDEVGPLELKGQGFAAILPQLLHSGKNLVITVRKACLEDFLDKYKIEDYRLILVNKK